MHAIRNALNALSHLLHLHIKRMQKNTYFFLTPFLPPCSCPLILRVDIRLAYSYCCLCTRRAQAPAKALCGSLLIIQMTLGTSASKTNNPFSLWCSCACSYACFTGLHDGIWSPQPTACGTARDITFEARSFITSGVSILPFLTCFSRTGRSSLRRAAFARLRLKTSFAADSDKRSCMTSLARRLSRCVLIASVKQLNVERHLGRLLGGAPQLSILGSLLRPVLLLADGFRPLHMQAASSLCCFL